MKIIIDTTDQIISLQEDVNLGELIDFLKINYPFEGWRSFKIKFGDTLSKVKLEPIPTKYKSFIDTPRAIPNPYIGDTNPYTSTFDNTGIRVTNPKTITSTDSLTCTKPEVRNDPSYYEYDRNK